MGQDSCAAREGEGRGEFELFLAELSAHFVGLAPEEVDHAIEAAQRSICDRLALERSTVWQRSREQPELLILTHAYQKVGSLPLAQVVGHSMLGRDQELLGLPSRSAYWQIHADQFFPWVTKQLRMLQTTVIPDVAALPEEAAVDQEMFRRYEARATVVVPLSAGGDWLGCVTFATVSGPRNWSNSAVGRFELIAHLFSNALARKYADLTLRESEARLNLSIAHAGGGLWSLDLETDEFWFSSRALELFLITESDRVSFSVFQASIHPGDRDFVDRSIRRGARSGECVSFDFRVLLPGGGYRWVACRGQRNQLPYDTRAELMGIAVDISERKQLEEAATRLSARLVQAHEDERARLARELHDDVTQRVMRLAIDVGCLKQQPVPPGAAALQAIRTALVDLGNDIYNLSYRLHPSTLGDLGLLACVRDECDRFTRRGAAAAICSARELSAEPPPEVGLCVFRVLQEALNNVERHACADTVEVSLREVDDGLELVVRDNGVGFPMNEPRSGRHLGLSGMQERVALLGGEIDLESVVDGGTTVLAWVPMNPPESVTMFLRDRISVRTDIGQEPEEG